MKSFLAMMLLLLVSFSYTSAGDEYYEKKSTSTEIEEREVIYYDFNLELELENGVALASWDDFRGEGFDWYKLVYSSTNTDPVYPNDKTAFVGAEGQTESSVRLKTGKNYIRICAITLNDDYSKDRYCGKTQTLEWDGASTTKSYTAKKVDTVKQTTISKTQTSKTELSDSVKDQIKSRLENFMSGLEGKGYTDDQIVSILDEVMKKLEAYRSNERYALIMEYILELLEAYKAEYQNDLDILDDIFGEY